MATTPGEVTIKGKKWQGDEENEEMVRYTDKSGNVLSYRLVDGMNVSAFFPLRFMKQIKGFKFRPDDVYLPGYMRTGTNWTNELACMLLNGKADTIPGLKPHLEMVSEEDLDKLSSPRVVNAHVWMTRAPDDLRVKKNKVIFTIRDPRDVIVSLYDLSAGRKWSDHPYNGSFSDYLQMHLEGKVDFGGVFTHWRAAEKFFDENPDIPVHIQVYEETIQDPVKSVQKLSDFLGLKRDDDLCKTIAEKCEFSKMKADKDPYTLKLDGLNVLFRQGKSGDWKNYFTEDLLDEYYRVYEEKMAGSRFYDFYARK